MRHIKLFLKNILFVLGFIFVVGFVIYLNLGKIIASQLSIKLHTDVTIGKMIVRPTFFTIYDLRIYSPCGSKLTIAFQAEELRFDIPLIRFLYPRILFEQITISNVYAGVEFYDKKNTYGNWTQLLSNLESHQPEVASQSLQMKTIFVHHLIFNNSVVDLAPYAKAAHRLKPIPQLAFHNVNSQKGLPMNQITDLIARKFMQEVSILGNVGNMLQTIISIPANTVKGLLSPFKPLVKNKYPYHPPH